MSFFSGRSGPDFPVRAGFTISGPARPCISVRNKRDYAYDKQSSSHFAISMVGGTENTLEPLYVMKEMLEYIKTFSAFADAQNHVFHL